MHVAAYCMFNYECNKIIGVYLGPMHSPPTNEEVTNPAYYITDDDHCKEPVEKPIGHYAEVIIPTQVKMTPNPAYAVP